MSDHGSGTTPPLYATAAFGAAPTTLTMRGGSTLGGTALGVTTLGSFLALNSGVPGPLDSMNGALVIATDLFTENSVVHKIDAVLGPDQR